MDKNKTFKVKTNGIEMLSCEPLSFEIVKDRQGEIEGHLFSISVGEILEMWMCVFDTKENIVSIYSLDYSNDSLLKFECNSFVEASELIHKFAKGMDVDMSDTIFEMKK